MVKYKVLFLAVLTTFLVGCNGLGKMQKCIEEVKVSTTPNPLEAKGDKVGVKVNMQFPTRYFDRRSKLEITPTLVYNSTESKYKSFSLQGEKFPGNDKFIAFKAGGDHTYTGEIPFKEGMENAELQLRITGYRGKKTKVFKSFKIADGVVASAYLVQNDDRAILGADAFKRITEHEQRFIINFLVNSSVVLGKELNDADVNEAKAFLKLASKNKDYTIKGVNIEAFASPEGELRKNESLAEDRGESAKRVTDNLLKSVKLDNKSKDFYSVAAKGEDWQGFKDLMEKSKIADKELILRMLTMYADPQKREEEIRNLSATFTEVSEQILPKLRRSTVAINYQIQGKTDEQILLLARTSPSQLNAEELLFAATLTTDESEKMKFYSSVESQFPTDYRGANNVGYLLFKNGDFSGAKAKFEKANGIKENPVTNNNLGILMRRNGDRAAAAKLISSATDQYPDAKYNLGIIDLQNGEYGSASMNMANQNTFNAALALTLGEQYSKAADVLKASPAAETAEGHYLGAIINARAKRVELMVEHLTAAVKADGSYKAKAKIDAEFIPYRQNPAFQAIVK